MSLVDLGEVALTQQVVEVEDVVLNLLAGYLLTLLLAHPPSFDDNLIITYIIHSKSQIDRSFRGIIQYRTFSLLGIL